MTTISTPFLFTGISVYVLLTGGIIESSYGHIVGREFLFGIFSLQDPENQSFIINNPSADKPAVVNIARQGFSTIQHTVLAGKESLYVNEAEANDSFLVRSNQDISVQGLFGRYNILYDILPITSLGTNYVLVYGVNFNASTTVCCITALQNDTTVTIKTPESRKISYSNMSIRSSNVNLSMAEMQSIHISSHQGLHNITIKSSALVSIICGQTDNINNVRVHLPPTDTCVTSYEVPCFNRSRVPSGETHIRIFKMYPLFQDSREIYIDGARVNKTKQEKSIDVSFNVTADGPFCIRSHIRKWKSGLTNFVDDDFQFLTNESVSSFHGHCRNESQKHNSTHSGNNNKTNVCMCPCKHTSQPVWHNLTQAELSQWLKTYKAETRKELILGKKNLMSSKIRRISAHDPRLSARRIGVIGVIIICGLVGAIVSLDCPRVWRYFRRLNGKIMPEYQRESKAKVNTRKRLH